MIRTLGRATLVASVIMLAACESLFLFSDANVSRVRQETTEQYRLLALEWEQDGDLRRAVEAWRVVEALAPESQEPGRRIRALEKRINAKVRSRVAAARKALRRGSPRDAKTHLLMALALDPSHDSAADLLRGIDNKQMAAEMATSSKEAHLAASGTRTDPYSSPDGAAGYSARYALSDNRHDHDHGRTGVAEQPLELRVAVERGEGGVARSAHLRLAALYRAENKLEQALEHLEKAREQGTMADGNVDRYIAETRAALAEQFYREGVRSFRSNLGQSIQAFEKALDYNPEHERAKHYLSTSLRLRQQRNANHTVP